MGGVFRVVWGGCLRDAWGCLRNGPDAPRSHEGLGVPDGFSGPDRSGGPGSSDGPDYPGDLRCPVGHNSHLPSFVSLFPKHLRRVKNIKEGEKI